MSIVKKQQEKIEIDMLAVLKVLWKRKWLILLSGFAAALLYYWWTVIFVAPAYFTSATLYANNSTTTDVSTSISSSELNTSARLVNTYAAIILSDPVLDQVIEDNGLNETARTLAACISVSAVNNTEVFKISVRYPSSQMAAQIANSIADIAPGKIAEIVDGCSVRLISYAKVPVSISSPDYKAQFRTGFWFGIIVSSVLAFLVALVDTRVKGETDLNEWEYPVLGIIPSFEDAEKTGVYGYGNKEINKNEPIQ